MRSKYEKEYKDVISRWTAILPSEIILATNGDRVLPNFLSLPPSRVWVTHFAVRKAAGAGHVNFYSPLPCDHQRIKDQPSGRNRTDKNRLSGDDGCTGTDKFFGRC